MGLRAFFAARIEHWVSFFNDKYFATVHLPAGIRICWFLEGEVPWMAGVLILQRARLVVDLTRLMANRVRYHIRLGSDNFDRIHRRRWLFCNQHER